MLASPISRNNNACARRGPSRPRSDSAEETLSMVLSTGRWLDQTLQAHQSSGSCIGQSTQLLSLTCGHHQDKTRHQCFGMHFSYDMMCSRRRAPHPHTDATAVDIDETSMRALLPRSVRVPTGHEAARRLLLEKTGKKKAVDSRTIFIGEVRRNKHGFDHAPRRLLSYGLLRKLL